MGHQIYILLCIETTLSNYPGVIPKSSCDVHLLRSPWVDSALKVAKSQEISPILWIHVNKRVDWLLIFEVGTKFEIYSEIESPLLPPHIGSLKNKACFPAIVSAHFSIAQDLKTIQYACFCNFAYMVFENETK